MNFPGVTGVTLLTSQGYGQGMGDSLVGGLVFKEAVY